MAHPQGLRNPFRDLGPEMAVLLAELDLTGDAGTFVASCASVSRGTGANIPLASPPSPPTARGLAAGPVADQAARAGGLLIEEFTNRELEILGLLARRLSNKKIAAQLYISPATVKRHNANIFDKMQVRVRREAVVRAESLGMLARVRHA